MIAAEPVPDLRLWQWALVVGRVELGDGIAVVEDSEGMHYFEHLCSGEVEVPRRGTARVSPMLSNHTRSGPLAEITIAPSILCPDCGLHGFVTGGVWNWKGC